MNTLHSPTPTSPSLITLEEFAELVRAPISTVRHWRSIGRGPHFARFGRRLMARREDVEKWINEQFESAE